LFLQRKKEGFRFRAVCGVARIECGATLKKKILQIGQNEKKFLQIGQNEKKKKKNWAK
jgi:hypothetical protein